MVQDRDNPFIGSAIARVERDLLKKRVEYIDKLKHRSGTWIFGGLNDELHDARLSGFLDGYFEGVVAAFEALGTDDGRYLAEFFRLRAMAPR